MIFVPARQRPTVMHSSGTEKRAKRRSKSRVWHPAGDELPYILGHIIFVPSETGASYGDLDEQYLTASYRVYLNEADAKKVFAYIKHLQETSPLWNAATTNCTAFIGRIANFYGPERSVSSVKA